uniref:Uncharacterized protein n=1 Tax=Anopheles coluzzii TaxID=1518534 RepID=A0A8W7P9V3_ANOCL
LKMNDFSTVCRLCFNPTASNVEDDQIYQQINLCLGLVINPTNKSWPYRVCSSCAEKVREFHKYRESCWDVHSMLLNVLNGENTVDTQNEKSTIKNVMKKDNETTNSCSDEVTDDSSDTKAQGEPSKAQPNVVICEICGKTMLPTYYQGHLNEHNGLKPFACVAPGCSKTFPCRHGLRRHSYYRHSGQMFLCQECGKAYKSKLELSTHRLHVHTRGKAFGCVECGKSFVTRSYLTTHRKAHTSGPQVQCSYCPKMLYISLAPNGNWMVTYSEDAQTGEVGIQQTVIR